ncbi:MAG TPA: 2-amino-4-hydroxy-6-hydroxymethyldihydropteridine diphosphokinase [Microbacteriaceae bacterium]|nr:2-amino-4-hydroxy-6-hydroxymethyldihydropteridine diphosphokinase [Microbacteriaceae bacterium]
MTTTTPQPADRPTAAARWADHTVPGDHITLTGLRAFAHHGVFQHEKNDGQEFVADVTVWFDIHAAAAGDDVAATVDYGRLAGGVVAAIERDPVDLIETVAERIAAVALGFAAVRLARVTLHKPHAPITVPFDDVAVTIERGRAVQGRDRGRDSAREAGPRGAGGTHAVVLALGANLGEREENLRGAVADLAASSGIEVTAVSALYATPALTLHGVDRNAPAYLNAVVLARTRLHPYALLEATSAIEDAHGRVRTTRWGARTLDIDIIDYDGRRLDDPTLTLPHPRAGERAFVLVPWLDVDPGALLVGRGPVADLVGSVDDEATPHADRHWADGAWPAPSARPA